MGVHLVVPMHASPQPIHRRQQRLPAREDILGNPGRPAQVAHLPLLLVGVARRERLVASTQPCRLPQLPRERRVLRDRHVGRHASAESQLLGHDRAHRRMIPERRPKPAAQHPVARGLMVVVLMRPGAHEREVMHPMRQAGQPLADPQAGDRRGNRRVDAADLLDGLRLGIEGVVVRNAATQEH